MARKKQPKGLKKITYGYSRSWQKKPFKVLYVLIFAAVFMLLGHYLFPSSAISYPYESSNLATTDFNRVTNYRTSHGWRTLNRASCLDTIASHWAKQEATQNAIQDPPASWMNGQLANYCSGHYWLAWGANDGMDPGHPGSGGELDIFNGFLASCEHLQNIADHGTAGTTINIGACTDKYHVYHSSYNVRAAAYNQIGTSAWVGSYGNGTLYVAQVFARW